MQTSLLLQGTLVLLDRLEENGIVSIQGKQIIRTEKFAKFSLPNKSKVISFGDNHYICPGLVDIHIHGALGHDVMDGTLDSLYEIGKFLTKCGVTTYLPTTMSSSLDKILSIIKNVNAFLINPSYPGPVASIGGIHLEGPWISEKKAGAQNATEISKGSIKDAQILLKESQGLLKIITLAPEIPGHKEVIKYLRDNSVIISAGHTSASFEEIDESINWGVGQFTHGFNAMKGFDHREPGTVGAMLLKKEIPAEIICDLVHVHPAAVKLLINVKGRDHVILISDSIRATGLNDGEYELGGRTVFVRNGEARTDKGHLAGSINPLNKMVYNAIHKCGIPVWDAIYMASTLPAKRIGFGNRKGCLAEGYDADIVIFDKSFNAIATWINGKQCWGG